MADLDNAMVSRQRNVPLPISLTLLMDKSKPGKDYSTHRLLIGTHTSGADQNYLQVADVQLPISSVELENYDDDKGGINDNEFWESDFFRIWWICWT